MFLTFDLGASRLRAGLVDADGHVLARHAIDTPAINANLSPDAWWEGIKDCAHVVLGTTPDRPPIEAIAISAMTRTQVLVDGAGRAIGPAIGFADTRAAATLDALRSKLPVDDPETAEINVYHPLARLYWLSQHDTAVLTRAAHVVDPKDYLNAHLTGVMASDPISLARLVASQRALFAAAGLDARLVPPLRQPASILAKVRAGLPAPFDRLAGVPVITMAHDTWASVLGLGALRAGYAYNLSGTTEVFGVCTARPVHTEGLLTVDWALGNVGADITQVGGPSLAGGDTIRWVEDLLGRRGGIENLAREPHDTAPPLLFLPYLAGERVPHWDPDLRGAWIGLDRRHGPSDLARAVLEGIAHLNRVVLDRAEAAVGAPVVEVRFGGGGAVNTLWCQIKADVLRRPVIVTESEDHGLVGAAIAASIALGSDAATAQASIVRIARRYEPDPAQQARGDILHHLFCDSEAAIAPISRRLAALGRG